MANANVQVVISAITQAAESAINDVGGELQGVAVDADVAQSGLGNVEDELNDTTTSATVANSALGRLAAGFRNAIVPATAFAGRVDEVGDEAVASAGQIGILRGAMFTLMDATDSNTRVMALLSTTTTASLIPALAGLLATLGPLLSTLGPMAGALGGVAAGMGAIVGTGALGYAKDLANANGEVISRWNEQASSLQQVKSETGNLNSSQSRQLSTINQLTRASKQWNSWQDALTGTAAVLAEQIEQVSASFGKQFIPLIADAVTLIPSLYENILESLGPMGQFKQALRDMGSTLFSVIPKATAVMADLGRAALPYLRELANFFINNLGRAIQTGLNVMSALEGPIRNLISGFLELNSTLMPLGTKILQILISALGDAAYWVSHLITMLSSPSDQFAPYINRATSAVQRLMTALGPLGSALHQNYANFVQLGATLVTVASNAGSLLVPALISLVNILGQVASMIANPPQGLVNTFTMLLTGVRSLQPGIAALMTALAPLNTLLPQVDASFLSTANTMVQSVIPAFFSLVNDGLLALSSAITTVMPFILNFASTVQTVGTAVKNAVMTGLGVAVTFLRTQLVNALSQAGVFWQNHRATVMTTVTAIRNAIMTQLSGAITWIQANVSTVLAAASNLWVQHRAAVTQTVTQVRNAIMTVLAGAFNWLRTTVPATLTQITTFWRNHRATVMKTASQIRNAIMSVLGTAFTWLRTTVTTALNTITSLWQKHRASVMTTAAAIRTVITQQVLGAFNTLLTIGQTSLTRLTTLWVQHRATVTQTATQLRNSIMNVLGGAFNWLQTTVPATLTRMSALWSQHRGTVVTILNELGQLIRITLTGAFTFLQQTATSVIQRMGALWDQHKAKVGAAVSILSTALTTLWNKIQTLLTPIKAWSVALKNADTNVRGLAQSIRSQANVSMTQLATTITSLLMPALGGTLVGAVTTLAVLFRGRLSQGIMQATTRATSLATSGKGLAGVFTNLQTYMNALIKRLRLGSTTFATLRLRMLNAADNARVLGSTIKSALSTALIALQGRATKLAQTLAGRFAPVLTRITGAVRTLGGAILSRLAPVITTLVTRFGSAIMTAGRLGSAIGLLTNPIGIVVAAVAGLYVAWRKNLFGIRDKTRQVFAALKALFKGDTSQMKSIMGQAATQITNLWQNKIKPLIQQTKQVLRMVGQAAKAAMNWLMQNAFRPVLRSIQQLWDTHGQEIMTGVGQLMDFLKSTIKVALGVVYTIWDKWGNEIRQATKFVFDAVGSVINTALDVIITAFTAFTDLLAGDWEGALNKLKSLAERIFGGILNFIQKWVSGFIKYVSNDLIDGVISLFEDLYQKLIGGSIIPEMFSGIMSALQQFVSDFISGVVEMGNDFISRAQEMKRKVTARFNELVSSVVSKIQELTRKVIGKVVELGNKFISRAQEIRRKVVDKFNQLKDDAVEKMKKMARNVMDYLTGRKGPLSNAKKAGKKLIKAFIGGIGSKMQAVGNAVDSIVQKARDKLPGSDAKEGPLSDLTAAGKALPETLAKGIHKRTRTASRAAEAIAAAAKPDLDGSVGRVTKASVARELAGSGQLSGGQGTKVEVTMRNRIALGAGATREDAEEAGRGLAKSFKEYGLDTY